jgi:hypothetical protein
MDGRKVALALAIGVLIGAAATIALVVTETPPTTTQQLPSTVIVRNSFAQHLMVFSSRNVSAIISQYEPNATVYWNGQPDCMNGMYPDVGLGDGVFNKALDVLFDNSKAAGARYAIPGLQSVFIGNTTSVTVRPLSNGSVVANSTFALIGRAFDGEVNATISLQDTYTFYKPSGTWLISGEFWHALSFVRPTNVLICAIA